jgi:hypothetical protein
LIASKKPGVQFEAVATTRLISPEDRLDFTHTNSLLYIMCEQKSGRIHPAAESRVYWRGSPSSLKKSSTEPVRI